MHEQPVCMNTRDCGHLSTGTQTYPSTSLLPHMLNIVRGHRGHPLLQCNQANVYQPTDVSQTVIRPVAHVITVVIVKYSLLLRQSPHSLKDEHENNSSGDKSGAKTDRRSCVNSATLICHPFTKSASFLEASWKCMHGAHECWHS